MHCSHAGPLLEPHDKSENIIGLARAEGPFLRSMDFTRAREPQFHDGESHYHRVDCLTAL